MHLKEIKQREDSSEKQVEPEAVHALPEHCIISSFFSSAECQSVLTSLLADDSDRRWTVTMGPVSAHCSHTHTAQFVLDLCSANALQCGEAEFVFR